MDIAFVVGGAFCLWTAVRSRDAHVARDGERTPRQALDRSVAGVGLESTLIALLGSICVTAAMLAMLALHDPKRVRTVARAGGQRGRTFGKPARVAFGTASIVPGVVLGVYGEWPAFLLWFGTSCAVGWLLTVVLAPPPRRERTRRTLPLR